MKRIEIVNQLTGESAEGSFNLIEEEMLGYIYRNESKKEVIFREQKVISEYFAQKQQREKLFPLAYQKIMSKIEKKTILKPLIREQNENMPYLLIAAFIIIFILALIVESQVASNGNSGRPIIFGKQSYFAKLGFVIVANVLVFWSIIDLLITNRKVRKYKG